MSSDIKVSTVKKSSPDVLHRKSTYDNAGRGGTVKGTLGRANTTKKITIISKNKDQFENDLEVLKKKEDNTQLINETIESVKTETALSVKEQKIGILIEGDIVERFSKKNKPTKIVFRLAPNKKEIIFGEHISGVPLQKSQPLQTITLSQIKEVQGGLKSASQLNVKKAARPPEYDSRTIMIILNQPIIGDNNEEETSIEIVTANRKSFCDFYDGLRFLLGLDPVTNETKQEIEYLADVLVDIRLFDFEEDQGFPLPPKIPPLPALDFYYGEEYYDTVVINS